MYNRLEKANQIRIIELHGSDASWVVHCDLRVVTLSDNIPYEALSYVWGRNTGRYTIVLDGHTIAVSDNLYCALRRLRPNKGTRPLWIDQLCINQLDDDERSRQVELMGAIYSNSRHTLLWLGEEPLVTQEQQPADQINIPRTVACVWSRGTGQGHVSTYFPRILDNPKDLTFTAPAEDLIYHAFLLISELANQVPVGKIHCLTSDEPICANTLSALRFIMSQPWWKRMWTVQECLLPRKALFLYGPVAAPFDMFIDASSFYTSVSVANSNFISQLPQNTAAALRYFTLILNDLNHYRSQIVSRKSIDLTSVLRTFRAREATDMRDKIYGVLGLPIDWHGVSPMLADYNLSTVEVYRTAALKLIQSTRSLSILLNNFDKRVTSSPLLPQVTPAAPDIAALTKSWDPQLTSLLSEIDSWIPELLAAQPLPVQNTPAEPPLPSWAPDWSMPMNPETLPRFAQVELYNAAGGGLATLVRADGETGLVLRGYEVDRVRRTSQIMAHVLPDGKAELLEQWWAFAREEVAELQGEGLERGAAGKEGEIGNLPDAGEKKRPGWENELLDAFWRTICGDCVAQGRPKVAGGSAFRRANPVDRDGFAAWLAMYVPAVRDYEAAHVTEKEKEDDEAEKSNMHVSRGIEAPPSVGAIDAAVRAATTMRRLFVTEQGRLGLAPPRTVGKEAIYVLEGGQEPFVLRNVGQQTWEMVGDCYVHGLMDGEALHLAFPSVEVHLV